MSSQDGHRADLRRPSTLNEPRLRDAVDWELLRTLNERCLDLMVQLARSDQQLVPPAVAANRAVWCGLDTAARGRAANSQLLLIDINFMNSAWWRAAAENASLELKMSSMSYLPPQVASELMLEVITLVWIVARADQGQAIVFCGIAPAVASLFSSFRPSDIVRLSAQYSRHLRLRFDDCPPYWQMHLRVAGRKPVSDEPHRDASSTNPQQNQL